MKDMEKLAKTLEAHDDYRVLRRLKDVPRESASNFKPEDLRHGAFLDVETTGLKDTDEVIEFCLYPFQFSVTGSITDLGDPIHGYNQPSEPIKPEITELTGITNEMVAGQKLPITEIDEWAVKLHLVVAHNAQFDRKHAERVTDKFEDVCWGCSMEQVKWKSKSRKLEHVLSTMGLFYDAHNAITDCFAGIRALAEVVDGKTALAHILEASRKKTYHVWAVDAPFKNRKGEAFGDVEFKPRGYYWSGGEDGRTKAWHKEIEDRDAEEKWLRETIYGGRLVLPARFDEVNAFNRFSKRG